jgi:hypothetical protein
MAMKPIENNRSRQGRIPKALQAVFLASNAGEVVDVPPRNLGFKVFSRLCRGKPSKIEINDKPVKNEKVIAPDNDEVCQTFPFCSSSVQEIS